MEYIVSTRANVVIKDSFGDELWFYRHSDGYPEGVEPTLEKFLNLVKDGKIRDNACQAAGWLILIGAEEYDVSLDKVGEDDFSGWKCGAYEPTTGRHGDIDYLYTIDLKAKTLKGTKAR